MVASAEKRFSHSADVWLKSRRRAKEERRIYHSYSRNG